MASIAELILGHTILSPDDVEVIEDLARQLQFIADVTQSDVFIDCPLADKSSALVVAEAHPSAAPSLYKSSVTGQRAYAHNEPAVMFCLASGQQVIGSRGISQEMIAMEQNVVPIVSRSSGKVIGALIMEKDISAKVQQEKDVERLMETTKQLSETLLTVAMSEGRMQSIMHEGIVLFDERETVTYANPRALDMLGKIGHAAAVEGRSVAELFYGKLSRERVLEQAGILREELQIGSAALELKAVMIYREQQAVGGLVLIRDISELKEKEKKLIIQSAVMKEIHHRVKNNLQTVSSLLRLQMRRTKIAEAENVYRDSINRINSIAIIHEMLAYDGLELIRFNDVADRVVKNIVSQAAKLDQNIRTRICGDELILPSDMATTLALVTNELVQNCVAHAFSDRAAGNIDISLQHSGRIVSLCVADNGRGIDPAGRAAKKDRLGLKITETLVQENLNGTMSIDTGAQGTAVQIRFPLTNAQPKEEEAS
ncbi:histidine kinase [Gordoniibacillus kamchatkensis]|uniref:histidine kinase n=1 Tax=Gordoniibacillus kamchatkensis TaxID=1590651 RepID=A0ABR5AFF3_9BACL|nr:histidine kinase N-terminal domain-containing protein [Paenibacillus sp. VKM B-2647]KIL39779.1 histidine kinase [Paenibacillus sp. VKM B-2647]